MRRARDHRDRRGTPRPAAPRTGPTCHPAHTSPDLAQRRAVELSVVELDPAVIELDGPPERLGGLTGAAERAAHDAGRRRDGGREHLGLAAAQVVEGGIEAAQQQTGGVGLGPPVTDDDQHVPLRR